MNQSQVIVSVNPKTGKVFTEGKLGKDGKMYGYIRVETTRLVKNGNFLKPTKVSALVSMSKEDFDANPIAAGTGLGGRIRIIESTTQELGAQPKLAGDSQVPCTLRGKQIFRKTEWDLSGEPDVLVAHDNSEAIKAAIANAKANASVNS